MNALERYRLISEKFRIRSAVLSDWLRQAPLGQRPLCYERAAEANLRVRYKLNPLWLRIRSRICVDGKTLWQHFPFDPDDLPPLYSEFCYYLSEGGVIGKVEAAI